MAFEFKCSACGEVPRGVQSYGAEAPLNYYAVPETERASGCALGTDDCVIDEKDFFVRGCIEIPVYGESDPLSWGVWVSLSESSFKQWRESLHMERRSHIGPFFGWLNAWLKPYPETMNL